MAKVSNLEIGVIIILAIVLGGGVIFWIFWDKGLKDCEKGESPLCLTGTCPSATSGCSLAPFKVGSDGKPVLAANGQMICKTSIINYPGGPPKVNAYST